MRLLGLLLLLLAPAHGDTGVVETVPAGAIVFMNVASCPDGWTEPFALRGRIVVGVTTNNAVGDTHGDPLESQEDRQHGHAVTATISVPSESVALASGCCNDGIGGNGSFAVTGTATPISTGLPTVGLRACQFTD